MPTVVGIVFRRLGRPYWFDPSGLDLEIGDRVIVETLHGLEVGTVATACRDIPEDELEAPLRRVLRPMTVEDEAQHQRNLDRARTTLSTAAERVAHFGLPMKLLTAEYTFDCSQVTIYFSADGRVDFRELVRDLAARLRTRVQLYQVGARDHTRMMGGYGTCGRPLCCSTFLKEFAPVSMRMAKDQSLLLNPVKFSGVCGKLMCCLRYEHDVYTEARTRLPYVGARVATPRGTGTVLAVSVVRDEVTVSLDDSEAQLTLPAAQVKGGCCRGCSDHSASELGDPSSS